jgi:CDP-paratose 2-epimerase
MNILITGGVGFIGANAALKFSKDNQIIIFDNFSRKGVGLNASLLQKQTKDITIIKDDIINIPKYPDLIKSLDVIIHLAGQTAVTHSLKNPLFDFTNNALSTITLLEEVRRLNPGIIVLYSSTNKVYGSLTTHHYQKSPSEKKYIDSNFPQGISESESLNFSSPYGCSKGSADQYMIDYYHSYGIRTVVFRQSCIYGPLQQGVEDQGWVAHFTKELIQSHQLKIFGDGYQVRDLLYIDDLISAYEMAINNIEKVKGLAFNIGGGPENAYSLLEVIEMTEKFLGKKANLSFHDPRVGDQLSFVSDNNLIKNKLNWSPKISFATGLSNLIRWQQKFLF